MNISTPTTQKDIADQLGLSQAVVSKVLGGDTTKVSPQTAELILDTATRMNYRKRRGERGRFIGVILQHTAQQAEDRPWDLRLLAGIQQAAHQANANVLQHLIRDPTDLRDLPREACGWISISSLALDGLDRISAPVVVLQHPAGSPRFDAVIESPETGIRTAVRRLAALGHRHFGYFNVRPWGPAQAAGYGAFHHVLSEGDLPDPDPRWIFTPRRQARTAEDTERLVRGCLETLLAMPQRPTAMFVAGDVYALPMLRLASGMGLSIPRDLSVFGYDDTPDAEFGSPTLSSIRQPLEDLGRAAVARLLARIGQPDLPIGTWLVPTLFQERGSTGPAPRTE